LSSSHPLSRSAGMSFEIVGREEELAAVSAFVDGAGSNAAALVLEGEAGIGKSTLWLAGVEHARGRGLRVLTSRPAEAERSLAHVGLGDRLEPLAGELLPALPPPRSRALEVALLVDDADADAIDPRALGIATRDALDRLADPGPLVVAIDDLQWFDASSAAALAVALRRLDAGQGRLVLGRRIGDARGRTPVEEALPTTAVRHVTVGPLSVGALHRFLRDRLGRSFARQTLLRIHERSGGNPFFALELARVLGADVDPV